MRNRVKFGPSLDILSSIPVSTGLMNLDRFGMSTVKSDTCELCLRVYINSHMCLTLTGTSSSVIFNMDSDINKVAVHDFCSTGVMFPVVLN